MNYIAKKTIIYTEPNGGKDNIVNEQPGIYFPISHLIEYYLLLRKPEHLLTYVMKTRIPSAKRYVKEISNIFSKIEKEIDE
ncbi:TPA: hypothetical protein N3D89_004560 [Salmonella enterica subsp. enterica serovar Yaba]|nr:hypothetical protein [Salmonella enterica subsp. enterica serovar Yaba]